MTEDVDPIVRAVRTGAGAELRALLAMGAPPDVTDATGHTLLMIAAARGDRDVVGALLAAGALPHLCDRGGRNAADCAADAGHLELAGLLRVRSEQARRSTERQWAAFWLTIAGVPGGGAALGLLPRLLDGPSASHSRGTPFPVWCWAFAAVLALCLAVSTRYADGLPPRRWEGFLPLSRGRIRLALGLLLGSTLLILAALPFLMTR